MNRRSIPAVERVRQALGSLALPRPIVVQLVREELASLRGRPDIPEFDSIVESVRSRATLLQTTRLQPVINATGILIHTNLGRAPLSSAAIERLCAVAAGYSNLEFDLATGARGSRSAYLELELALLCRAEAATVVNNCAAALLLILRHFTRKPDRTEVIISRGELIQIGGGFRVPEILEAGGARLREVGTTNRTALEDYARALGPATALILKVHRSNFSMDGFVSEPGLAELAGLARKSRVPLVEDLGSGALVDTAETPGLPHEPTPAESIRQGADLVCFSGDKLMGGPQAGIIVGRKRWISALKREPLFRSLRCDKLVLAALEATADHYLEEDAAEKIPLWTMTRAPADQLQARALRFQQRLAIIAPAFASSGAYTFSVVPSQARLGGGSLPSAMVDSVALEVRCRTGSAGLTSLATALRHGAPPVITTVAGGGLRFDLRTVHPGHDDALLQAIAAALRNPSSL